MIVVVLYVVTQITKYVQPTRDGEIEQWRVTYADGEHEDMDSFEVTLIHTAVPRIFVVIFLSFASKSR